MSGTPDKTGSKKMLYTSENMVSLVRWKRFLLEVAPTQEIRNVN